LANIGLIRIDSRLVHGQVTTKWLKQVQTNRIIIIDNNLVKDPFMSKVYSMAAPPGISVEVMNVETAVASWKKDQLGSGKIMILFRDVNTVYSAWQSGFSFDNIQIGGLGGAPGRKTVYQNVTLSHDDANKLMEMSKGGVTIIFQVIPEDTPAKLESILPKMK
jgi:D-glucosaminate-specific PTS system IIB component